MAHCSSLTSRLPADDQFDGCPLHFGVVPLTDRSHNLPPEPQAEPDRKGLLASLIAAMRKAPSWL
jgi:hypothetical protein